MAKMNIFTKLLAVFAIAFFASVNLSSANDEEDKVLTIGSKAPNIDVEHWVSDNDGAFEHTTTLKSDKVYVIEFWATWCGPCISAMPHIVELQEKYKDSVQVVSISDEDMETVEKFLERKVRGKDDETYADLTSTYCLTTDPDESVKKDYFRAAGRTGIPCAFIVGKTGVVEWIGHPMRMDEPLEKVVNDEWDREKFAVGYEEDRKKAAAMAEKQALRRKVMGTVRKHFIAKEYQEAVDYISEVLEDESYEGPQDDLVQLKMHAMITGNLEGTATEFKTYLEENLTKPRNMTRILASVLQAKGKDQVDEEVFLAARVAAASIAEKRPENVTGLFTHAQYLFHAKDYDKATEVLESALENAGPRKAMLETFLERVTEAKEEAMEKAAT